MVREGMTPLNDFSKIEDVLKDATDSMREASESPRLDAELLLARALDVPRSYLYAHTDEEIDVAARERFTAVTRMRIAGMPLAYLTGEKEFWSMALSVTRATLVPRPETETLVDLSLRHIPHEAIAREGFSVLELGTGSGAIALAIARERPLCNIVATDISEDALIVARENARRHDVANVEFLCGDWFAPVQGRSFDIIVSNPPYVADGDPHLQTLGYEPRLALAAGADGLDAIRRIAATASVALKTQGRLLLEHGSAQQNAVARILYDHGWGDITVTADMGGHPRVTSASRN